MSEKNFWKIFPVNRDSADAEPMHPEDHAALLAWVQAKVKENRHSLS